MKSLHALMKKKPVSQDRFVSALSRGEESYVIVWHAGTYEKALRQCGEWAANPDLSFSWNDATILSQRIRKAND